MLRYGKRTTGRPTRWTGFGAPAGRVVLAGAGTAPALLLATVVLFAAADPARADDWIGTFSADWFTTGNWLDGSVPTTADAVDIDTIMPNPTEINGGAASSSVVNVGVSGTGTLLIENGATLVSSGGPQSRVGFNVGSNGTLTVADSSWSLANALIIGREGTGTMIIADGGQVSNTVGVVGDLAGSLGTATITGAGSSWNNSLRLFVGNFSTGEMTIADGGTVNNPIGGIGGAMGAVGVVTVTGNGSQWTNADVLNIGNSGAGTLAIESGGTVDSGAAVLGLAADGIADVTVDGTDTLWTSASLTLGNSGTATMTVANGGTVHSTGTVSLASEASSGGTLSIGAEAGSVATAPGTVDAATVAFGAGTGTINFNHTATDYVFAPDLSGPSSGGTALVLQGAGTTGVTGNSTGFAGTTQVEGGTLRVDGALGGTLEVQSGGRLEGAGTVGEIANSGTVGPGDSIGTLTVDGDYTHTAGATFEVEIEPGGTADLLAVSGAATSEGGTVSVLLTPGDYAPGTEFTVLTADGGVTGEFATLDVDNPDVPLELVHESNRVFLVVSQQQEEGADLALGKTATVNEGGTVVFTLEATNNGPEAATGVTVTDTLPACTSYVEDDCDGAVDGSTFTWTIGALANGASVSCNVTVEASACDGEQTNTATVSGAETDPVPDNDTAEATFDIEVVPALPTLALALLAALLALAATRLLRHDRPSQPPPVG